MKPELDIRRYNKRLKQLQTVLKSAGKTGRSRGTCEDIHRLRVVLRRSRIYLRLGRFLFKGGAVKRFGQWSKLTSDIVGPVRDRDMALVWLKKHPELCDVARRVKMQRRLAWENARQRLKCPPPFPAIKKLKRGGEAKSRKKLAGRFHRAIQSARQKVMAYRQPFDARRPEGWHELRRVLRRWRYLHELQISQKELKQDTLLRAQLELQEFLGEAQNLNAVWLMVQPAAPAAPLAQIRLMLETERRSWLVRARAALIALQRKV